MSNVFSGPGITTSNGSAHCYATGIIRWNGNLQQQEVMSNDSWVQLPESHSTISLSGDTIAVIEWAKKKMAEEAELNALYALYPGLRDAKEKFELMLALVKEHK